jgi:hypothetical protein
MKSEQQPPSELDQETVKAYMHTFIPRFDFYPMQRMDGQYTQRKKPLTPDLVVAHLQGKLTLGAYALDEDSYARWICLDSDDDNQFAQLVQVTGQLAEAGVTGYLELSRRGGHLWLLIPRLPGVQARVFGKQLMAEYHLSPEIELYPKQDELRTGPGSLMRLPLGVHQKSGKRYHFVTADGVPLAPTIRDQIALLASPQIVLQTFIDETLAKVPPAPSPPPTPDFSSFRKGQGETLSETLKATVSVPDFVGRFVELDRQGRGHCPFHDDRHQSFQVSEDGNFWHCYAGCGGGSIVDFWMKWRETHGQGGSFTETIKELREMLL